MADARFYAAVYRRDFAAMRDILDAGDTAIAGAPERGRLASCIAWAREKADTELAEFLRRYGFREANGG